MPKKDGMAATKDIRCIELQLQRKRLPIVALTGDALVGSREKFIGCGMDDYLSKPVLLDQLRNTVSKFCPQPPARL